MLNRSDAGKKVILITYNNTQVYHFNTDELKFN